ncbi:hypothetical protein BKA82DRAFT_4430127 [Pisolithus tinctorius]|nr:hypothetical protein BKA82DRAFT_4430127 [Pisolithus tinctorius]
MCDNLLKKSSCLPTTIFSQSSKASSGKDWDERGTTFPFCVISSPSRFNTQATVRLWNGRGLRLVEAADSKAALGKNVHFKVGVDSGTSHNLYNMASENEVFKDVRVLNVIVVKLCSHSTLGERSTNMLYAESAWHPVPRRLCSGSCEDSPNQALTGDPPGGGVTILSLVSFLPCNVIRLVLPAIFAGKLSLSGNTIRLLYKLAEELCIMSNRDLTNIIRETYPWTRPKIAELHL